MWFFLGFLTGVAFIITSDKWLCWLGVHRWDYPAGHCESCGACDQTFNIHKPDIDLCPRRRK